MLRTNVNNTVNLQQVVNKQNINNIHLLSFSQKAVKHLAGSQNVILANCDQKKKKRHQLFESCNKALMKIAYNLPAIYNTGQICLHIY